MDQAYFVWLGVLAAGAVLGVFVRPRYVGGFVLATLALAVVVFVFGLLTGSEGATWAGGLALMAAPILGLIFFAGASVSHAGCDLLKRHAQRPEKHEG